MGNDPLDPAVLNHILEFSLLTFIVGSSLADNAETSRFDDGLLVPIPTSPAEVTRTLSLPAVSIVNVSAAGNLIAVLVSPV